MIDFQGSVKAVYPVGGLAKIWEDTIPIPTLPRHYEYGSRLRTKMVEFLKSTIFMRPDMEYYLNLGPAREPDEAFLLYKTRQKFQKALQKYRVILKSAIFVNTIEKLKNEQKEHNPKEGK